MDKIARQVFVGTATDAADESLVDQHDITTILSLTHDTAADGFPAEVTVHSVPLVDGPQTDLENFRTAVHRLLTRLTANDTVLVHCAAGSSRNPAVAATAIALDQEVTLEDAFQRVIDRRDGTDPHRALVRQAARICTEFAE
jgi:protein-tyrosine phosphatase